jgi:integrase
VTPQSVMDPHEGTAQHIAQHLVEGFPMDRWYLIRRPSGFYHLAHEVGKRKYETLSTHTKSKSEAEAQLRDHISGTVTIHGAKTVDEFFKEVEEDIFPYRALDTQALQRRAMSQFKSICGNIALKEITLRHGDRFKAKRLKTAKNPDGVSPVTVNMELRALKAILSHAVRWEYLVKHPFRYLQLCELPEERPTSFTQEELSALLSHIDSPWFLHIVRFALATGMRRSEIVNLRHDNISFAAETIEVISWQSFRTKAGKRRIIPMNRTSKEILQAQPQEPDGYVFHDEAGRKLLPDRLSRELHRALSGAQKAGEIMIFPRYSGHWVRLPLVIEQQEKGVTSWNRTNRKARKKHVAVLTNSSNPTR